MHLLNMPADKGAAGEIARRSRGTPRIANRLLRRIRDFSEVRHQGQLSEQIAKDALTMLEVDPIGLDSLDCQFLLAIIEKFKAVPSVSKTWLPLSAKSLIRFKTWSSLI